MSDDMDLGSLPRHDNTLRCILILFHLNQGPIRFFVCEEVHKVREKIKGNLMKDVEIQLYCYSEQSTPGLMIEDERSIICMKDMYASSTSKVYKSNLAVVQTKIPDNILGGKEH